MTLCLSRGDGRQGGLPGQAQIREQGTGRPGQVGHYSSHHIRCADLVEQPDYEMGVFGRRAGDDGPARRGPGGIRDMSDQEENNDQLFGVEVPVDQAPVWQLRAPFSARPSDSGSDALVSYEPKEPQRCRQIWHAIWHGRRKTGCDRTDSAGQA
jgi:hypothetical protein